MMPHPDNERSPQYFYKVEGICDGCNDLGNFYVDTIIFRIYQICKISVDVVFSSHIASKSPCSVSLSLSMIIGMVILIKKY